MKSLNQAFLSAILIVSLLLNSSFGKESTVKVELEKDESLILRGYVCVSEPIPTISSVTPPPESVCPQNSICIGAGCYCRQGTVPAPEGNACNGVSAENAFINWNPFFVSVFVLFVTWRGAF